MGDMQERELWAVAVFRLRESANRIFSLATRVRSQEVRGQLLRIYEQLRGEETKLATLADAAEMGAERNRQQRTPADRIVHNPAAASPDAPELTEASDD